MEGGGSDGPLSSVFLDYEHVIHEDTPVALTVSHDYDNTFAETIKECV
jgi:hypothetical protein